MCQQEAGDCRRGGCHQPRGRGAPVRVPPPTRRCEAIGSHRPVAEKTCPSRHT